MRALGMAGVVFLTIVAALGDGGWQRMVAASVLGFLALVAVEYADAFVKLETRRRR